MNPKQLAELRLGLAAITTLLHDVLDKIDGDSDLETADAPDDECNGDPEPSLGNGGHYYSGKIQYDLELDNSDCEPSLGWPERVNQIVIGCGCTDDLEKDVLDEGEQEEGV